MSDRNFDILGLSKKEVKVLNCILDSNDLDEEDKINTPLLINRKTKISRTAIYHILEVLRKRGLITKHKLGNKNYYSSADASKINDKLNDVLSVLSDKKPTKSLDNSNIIIHQGTTEVKACFVKMFTQKKNTKFVGVQGNNTLSLYTSLLGEEFVNDLNKKIKSNKIISDGIVQEGWKHETRKSYSAEWAKHYAGRMANIHQIEKEYFNKNIEIFLFEDSLYLIALRDEHIIEIKNHDIANSIGLLIKYIMDHTRTVDINSMVRDSYNLEEKDSLITC